MVVCHSAVAARLWHFLKHLDVMVLYVEHHEKFPSTIQFRNSNTGKYIYIMCDLGSSVGIVTDYRLDGLGSNPVGDKIFCLSRPALGVTQPPVKWVPGLSRGYSAAGACC